MSRVLIVEDDPILLSALKIKLSKEGYEVLTASNGEEAVEKIKTKPDAICLDILLPKKSGIEVMEEIQSNPELKAIPVIIISNSGQKAEIETALRLGAKDVLIKANFTPQDVLDKLIRYAPSRAQPKKTTAPSLTSAVLAADPTTAGGKVILVVEDDVFLCRLLTEKLAKEGLNVAEAASGEEALAYLRQNRPSLVLLDLMLTGAVDGFGVLSEMKKNPALQSLPVIVLSNLGDKENIDRAMALGAQDYLIKAHFVLDEIIAKIRKII